MRELGRGKIKEKKGKNAFGPTSVVVRGIERRGVKMRARRSSAERCQKVQNTRSLRRGKTGIEGRETKKKKNQIVHSEI